MGNRGFICRLKSVSHLKYLAEARAGDLNLEHGYEKFYVYKCDSCGFYHLTTQNQDK